MKVLILAGGFGSRLGEETGLKPKPMIEIGGKPILWHIMKIYSSYGFSEFVILLGYKGYIIKEYFANYFLHQSDVTIDLRDNSMEIHKNMAEPWRVTLLDTGLNTFTGGRVKRAQDMIGKESFMLTYGDGVSDINIRELVNFHKSHGKAITMTAVMPEGRFGALDIQIDNSISNFREKPKGDGSWINGGFFVCNTEVFDYITDGDSSIFERKPLEDLAKNGEMFAYKHHGFWRRMDTMRDKEILLKLWDENEAPWKVW